MSEFPQELLDSIRNIPDDCKNATFAFAAYEFVKFIAGFEVRENMFSDFPIAGNCPSERRLEWLAASLFVLRNDPLLPELCKRLRERNIRSPYFEISAACFCREIGLSPVPSPGIATRGFDYDFSAEIGPLLDSGPFSTNEKINVEVTELQSGAFDTKRVVSSLNAKRRQLPTDAPNMIFCKIPYEWAGDSSNISRDLDSVAERFFRGSKRVNALVFMRENWSSENKVYLIHYVAFISSKVRHKADRLSICISEYFRNLPKSDEDAQNNLANSRDYPRFRLRDFHNWVESILN